MASEKTIDELSKHNIFKVISELHDLDNRVDMANFYANKQKCLSDKNELKGAIYTISLTLTAISNDIDRMIEELCEVIE